MTDLDRHRRPQDLGQLRKALESYRDQEVDFDFDLARVAGFKERDPKGRRQVILSRLQERLFEVTRRNRLLHFRATLQSVNLTQASVPMVLDVRSIRPEQLLTWGPALRRHIVDADPIPLGRYLRFEDHAFLPGVLDQIRAEARRDRAEYGFSQLRLVLCMLRWTDLKESRERFESPLVLLPVELEKRKGVRDVHLLRPLTAEAEVNPVVRHVFRQNYGIDLPESLDLAETDLDAFFDFLTKRIQASEPGVNLEKIEHPRIELIHDRARRRLDQYRRRARSGARAARSFQSLDYSYAPESFAPLGLKLFEARVRAPETRLHSLLDESPRTRSFAVPEPAAGAVAERESLHYHLKTEAASNPYSWEFDLCSLTLTNLRSRKMTLVRDYEALLSEDVPSSSFDLVFSLAPRSPDEPVPPEPFEARFPVVPCDPTQASSIAAVASGRSLIVQGPPGTGKSQTITNLIADLVARGKRVLFVCEKRAAIDVVHHRLKQAGLEELVCLVHDSQTDKKAVIQDLKATYEAWLGHTSDEPGRRERERDDLVRSIRRDLAPIERYDRAVLGVPDSAGIAVQGLIERLLEIGSAAPPLDPLEVERLPPYRSWIEHDGALRRFQSLVAEIEPTGVFALHPLRRLSPALAEEARPVERVSRAVAEASSLLAELTERLESSGLPKPVWNGIAHVLALGAYSRVATPFLGTCRARASRAGEHALEGRRESLLADHEARVATLSRRKEMTVGWKEKLGPPDTEAALGQAREVQGALGFLRPSWWRLRRLLGERYDFRSSAVRPTRVQILEWLMEEHRARGGRPGGRRADRRALRSREAGSAAPPAGRRPDRALRRLAADPGAPRAAPGGIEDGGLALLGDPRRHRPNGGGSGRRAAWCRRAPRVSRPRSPPSAARRHQGGARPGSGVPLLSRGSRGAADGTGRLVPGPSLRRARRRGRTRPEGVPGGDAVGPRSRTVHVARAEPRRAAGRGGVPAVARRQRRSRSRTGPRPVLRERPAFRVARRGPAGRSEVPQASVRPGAEGARARARQVDALPLDPGPPPERGGAGHPRPEAGLAHEPAERVGHPAAGRAAVRRHGLRRSQPDPARGRRPVASSGRGRSSSSATRCSCRRRASSRRRTPRRSPFTVEEDGEVVEYDLDSDSLLDHAARSLPATMLGWHYRSRSESLISFSNAAFYGNGLLTVPEKGRGRSPARGDRARSPGAGRASTWMRSWPGRSASTSSRRASTRSPKRGRRPPHRGAGSGPARARGSADHRRRRLLRGAAGRDRSGAAGARLGRRGVRDALRSGATSARTTTSSSACS